MFDFTIAKTELLPRLLAVSGAVDKKQTLAILANILVKLQEDKLILTATDLEMEIEASVVCHTVNAIGELTIPARKLIDIVRSLDDDSIAHIKAQANNVLIKTKSSQFKLASLPADKFPACAQEVPEISFILPKLTLIQLIQSTHFAMSQQDVRIFLNGLLLHLESHFITAVATDGHRMAIRRTDCPPGLTEQKFLLPRKGVQEMLRLLNSIEDEDITIQAGKTYFKLLCQDYAFTTKLIEARFPPYHKAIPVENDKFVIVEKDALKRSLSRIVILAHEKSRAVLMHLHPGGLTLIANNQEQEEATEHLDAHVEGHELKIGINASYLLDVLNFMSDAHIRLSMSATDKSILVESLQDESYQYVIMPMKL